MPLVQYSHPSKGVNVTRGIPTPRAVMNVQSWVTAARKVLPDIPRFAATTDPWYVRNEILTEHSILLEVHNLKTKDRFALVFDRKRDNIGFR